MTPSFVIIAALLAASRLPAGTSVATGPEFCLLERQLALGGVHLLMPRDSVTRLLGKPLRQTTAPGEGDTGDYPAGSLVYRHLEIGLGRGGLVERIVTRSAAAPMPTGVRVNQALEEVVYRLGASEELQDLEEVSWSPPLCDDANSQVTFLWDPVPGPYDPTRAYQQGRRLARIELARRSPHGIGW